MSILERLEPVYPELDLSRLEDYLVEDCCAGDDLKVVLLGESPHTREIEARPHRPLVGRSGKDVADVLRELVVEQPGGSRVIATWCATVTRSSTGSGC